MSSFLYSNLSIRLFSSIVLIPIIFGLVWVGDWVFNVAVVVFLFVSLKEWYNLSASNLSGRGKFFLYGIPLFLILVAMLKGLLFSVILSFCAIPLIWYYVFKQHQKVKPVWKARPYWVSFGFVYIFSSMFSLIHLRSNEEQGLVYIVYLLAVVWGTDIGAYVFGRLIGGAKLLPKISPKKTWAGLIGGMITAGIFGGLVEYWKLFGGFCFKGFGSGCLVFTFYDAACLGMILAIFAQVGDFAESYVKRRVDVKDSGKIIPGHGGLLDRIDGLLPVSILLNLIILLME